MKRAIQLTLITLSISAAGLAGCELGEGGEPDNGIGDGDGNGDGNGDGTGDGNGGGNGGGDGGDGGDGGGDGGGTPAACAVSASLTASGGQGEFYDDAQGQAVVLAADIMDGATPDLLLIELYAGAGVFAGGLTTGSFPLRGDAECDACGGVVVDNTHLLVATGGTIDIAELGASVGGQFSGTISGASFVEADGETYEPIPGGCTTSIANATISVTLAAGQ